MRRDVPKNGLTVSVRFPITHRMIRCLPSASLHVVLVVVAALVVLAGNAAAIGEDLDPTVREEIRYVRGLRELGFVTYAEKVLQGIKDSRARPIIKAMEVELLASQGKFDEARKVIAGQADQNSQETWAMKLALGDIYFAWGRYPEAQGIYRSFFKQYPDKPPPGLNDFYRDSAYKYAQMLLLMGREEDAVEAYENVAKAKLEKHVHRQIRGETAELLVKVAARAEGARRDKYVKKIEDIANELMWVRDLWFGKMIVVLAHVKKIQGDVDGAVKLLDDKEYRTELQYIDRELKKQAEEEGEDLTKLSPMAQARYLVGSIMHEEAERLHKESGDQKRILELLVGRELKQRKKDGSPRRSDGAFQHFVKVFARYPTTTWAPEAGVRARSIKEFLEREYEVEVSYTISDEQLAKVRTSQFQQARNLFNQRQFKEAGAAYETVLNLFPEADAALSGLSDLVECYLEENRELYADMVVSYMAERFSGNPLRMSTAGDRVLGVAEKYRERGMPEKADWVYNLYFEHFEKHPRVAGMLLMFGNRRFDLKDYDGAIEYYEKAAAVDVTSPAGLAARSRIATSYHEKKEYGKELKALGDYVKLLESRDYPGHALIGALYREANAYRDLGGKYLPAAFNRYQKLVKLLTEEKDKYGRETEEVEANEKVLEASMFYKAYVVGMLPVPEGKSEHHFKLAAITMYEALVDAFPKSDLAPKALSQVGTLYTIMEKPDEAQQALDKLQRRFPESPEAKNALFMLGKSLLDMGMRDRAVRVFKQMFTDSGGRYSDIQILTAGQELLAAGESAIALEAFDRVLSSAKERKLVEPALLGKGDCLYRLERHAEAVKAFEEFFEEYPRSGRTVRAAKILSLAYAEVASREPDSRKRLELFNKAIEKIQQVRTYDRTPGGRARSIVDIGKLNVLKARAEEEFGVEPKAKEYLRDAVGNYKILIISGDPSDAEVRAAIEVAYFECMPLLLELEMHRDVISDADEYARLYPSGPNLQEIRKFRNKARAKLLAAGEKLPEEKPNDVEEEEAEAPAPLPEDGAPVKEEASGETPAAKTTGTPAAAAPGT